MERIDSSAARPATPAAGPSRAWPSEPLRRFEGHLLAWFTAGAAAGPAAGVEAAGPDAEHGAPGDLGLGLARRWDELRRALGLARLELRTATRGALVAPGRYTRRSDEDWLRTLSAGAPRIRAAGAGPLAGLEVDTLAWRSAAGLVVAQGPRAAWPAEPQLEDFVSELARLGQAALQVASDARERLRLRRLARIGTRAGGRLHDLRNQLTLALFRADVAAHGDDERARTARVELVEDLRRARELAADGIAFQRALDAAPETDGGEARPLRRIPLRALLVEEARALGATARASGARVRARCPAELDVLGDSAVLGRLVRNLLLNAAESRGGGAVIGVDVARTAGARARIVIEDDGRGMDAAALAGYLEAGRTVGGSGFGTASVREALERLDGALTVQSAPARGTRVELDLWAAPPQGAPTVLVVGPRAALTSGLRSAPKAPAEEVFVASPLSALALLDGLAPVRIELHRATLGPGRRPLARAAARLGIPVITRSARESFAVTID